MSINNAVSNTWEKFLDGFLPNRIKRMIFLSSLMAYIQGTRNPDEEIVGKFNQLLNLSSSTRSSMVPPLMNQRIWTGIVPRTEPVGNTGITLSNLAEVKDYKLFSHQARKVSDNIIKRTPYWLKYGSNKQIREDLVKLLVNVNHICKPS